MDFQAICDNIPTAACVMSGEKFGEDDYGNIRIVTGNKPYIASIEHPVEQITMLTEKFVPNQLYTKYIPRDLNFEDACYNAAVHKQVLHSYAHAPRFDVWFDLTFLPLIPDDGNICYCLYIMDINIKPDPKRMSSISADIASAVLETFIKLRSAENFKETMSVICSDIRAQCGSEHCCIMLMDTEKRKCSVLCEAFADGSKLLPMDSYLDENFYDIADSWKTTIAGSNCVIVKNTHDMKVVQERNPAWYESLKGAGCKNIVLFPLEFKGELLGYIWSINFNAEAADLIKEILEITTFILASELYSYRMLDKLHILSSTDMLTGVMNRNEMNNFIDALAKEDTTKSVGIIFVDLNGLKRINDNEGHNAGDRLLKNAADAMRDVFAVHQIFRAGGDEFVVVLTDVTEDELESKADKLRKISERYDKVVFAIGTGYEADVKNVRAALHNADERMYSDKKAYYEKHPNEKMRS